MLATILGLLGGLSGITSKITDAYLARSQAQTNEARIEADVQIKTLEAKRDVLVAESRGPLNQIMRALYALPPAVYLAKLFIWDKVLALGSTDPLSDTMERVLWTALGFYFLTELVERVKRK